MTTTVTSAPSQQPTSGEGGGGGGGGEPGHRRERPPARPTARPQVPLPFALITNLLSGSALLVLAFGLHLVVVGALQQNRSQDVLYHQLRSELAAATAPIDASVARGEPVALLEIPSLGVSQVVVEGTGARELREAPGHRADTVLPGQTGTSVLMGRAVTYGGPFRDISRLAEGELLRVVTGQGEFLYKVVAVRREGDPFPQRKETSRLTLVTAEGRPVPDAAVYVDAVLVGGESKPDPGGRPAVDRGDRSFGTDPEVLYVLVLQLQAVLAIALGLLWFARNIGRWQTYLVGVPVVVAAAVVVFTTASGLLPNLL